MPQSVQLALNSGELSPYLRHRTDFDRHPSGAARMENLLPLPHGGIRKRPGTLHDKALAASTRLETVHFDTATAYLLLFTATGLTILGSDGTTVKDTIAFSFGDPFKIQLKHVNSYLWLASPEFHPQQLVRESDTVWTIAELPFTYPPFLDLNPLGDDFTLSLLPSGSTLNWTAATAYTAGQHVVGSDGYDYTCHTAHTSSAAGAAGNEPGVGIDYPDKWRSRYLPAGATGLLSCSPSFPVFEAGHVGSYWELLFERDPRAYETVFRFSTTNSGKYSREIVIQGTWLLTTFGQWDGVVTVQRSLDGGANWEDIRRFENDNTRNITAEGTERNRCLLRLKWVEDTAIASAKGRGILAAGDPFLKSIVRIDSFTVGFTTASVTAINDATLGTSTDLWREGAFSTHQGFPKALETHERRLFLAGTTRHPLSLWASASDDLLDFTPGGVEADDSLFFTLAADTQDPVRWLASHRRLIIGTAAAEWVAGSESSDSPLTPENLTVRPYTRHGSAALPALRLDDAVYFVERQGRRLREFAYQLDRETYTAADLSRIADHITAAGIVQLAWQPNREPTLWVIDGDGQLLSFAYNRAEKLAAWARHSTRDGYFRSAAVLRSDTAGDDTLFLVVERNGAYHLEHFPANQQLAQENAELGTAEALAALKACHHLDGGIHRTGAATTTVTTPAHLSGVPLTILADGYLLPDPVAPSGTTLTLPGSYSEIHAGLPIASTLVTLPLDLPTEAGSTHGRVKRANKLALALFHTRGGTLTYNATTSTLVQHGPDLPLDAPAPLVSGWHRITLPPGHLKDLQLTLNHSDPTPFTLTALALEWALTEQ